MFSLDCGIPTIANGDISLLSGTTLGQNATVVCDQGYDIDGSGILSCTIDGWTNDTACVIQGKCTALYISDKQSLSGLCSRHNMEGWLVCWLVHVTKFGKQTTSTDFKGLKQST